MKNLIGLLKQKPQITHDSSRKGVSGTLINQREPSIHFYFLFFATILLLWLFLLVNTGHNPLEHFYIDQHTLQAKAWLSGRIYLTQEPDYLELAEYNDTLYVSFPPVPTIVELILVLIFGGNTPNTLVLLLCTWSMMLLTSRLLYYFTSDAVWSVITAFACIWGSSALYMSLEGSVWHQGQLYGFAFGLSAISTLFLGRRPVSLFFASVFLGLAAGCRPFYVFLIPFFVYHIVKKHSVKPTVVFSFIAGLLLTGIPLAVYNYVRFDSIFEFGHRYLPWSQQLKNGIFSISYFSRNIKHALIYPPEWNQTKNVISFNGYGTGLLFSSPFLLLSFLYFFNKHINPLEKVCAIVSLAALWGMLLVHESNGWFQFGYRYFVDIIPLCIYFIGRVYFTKWNFYLPLILYSVGINIYGAHWFFQISEM